MKRILLQIFCMMAAALASARTVTTFDFTKPDADNKLFGVELLNNSYGYIGFATVLELQNIKISFTEITGSTDQRGPLFKSLPIFSIHINSLLLLIIFVISFAIYCIFLVIHGQSNHRDFFCCTALLNI